MARAMRKMAQTSALCALFPEKYRKNSDCELFWIRLDG